MTYLWSIMLSFPMDFLCIILIYFYTLHELAPTLSDCVANIGA